MNLLTLPFKPMLAYGLTESQLKDLKYPVIVQPKIDGIRCCVLRGSVLSRKLKPIPNKYIRKKLQEYWQLVGEPYLLDGELTLKDYPPASFQEIQSKIMSVEGEPNYRFTIFDYAEYKEMLTLPYSIREEKIAFNEALVSFIAITNEQLLTYEETITKQGYEGIIIRSLNSPYKYGRSTFKESGLLKFKRFEDAEAIIKGFECLYTNTNADNYNAVGNMDRSTNQKNMIPQNTLGVLICEVINGDYKGQTIRIGTGKGLTHMLRKLIWRNKQFYTGKTITFQYQRTGSKDLPRILTMKSMRVD